MSAHLTEIKSYRELSLLSTFEERFEYIKLQGIIGYDTFGYDRYLNQNFYRSVEWKMLETMLLSETTDAI